MRIGYDAKRLFNNRTGLGNYSRTLVHNFVSQYPETEVVLYTPKVKDDDRTKPFLQTPYRVITPSGIERLGWRSYGMARRFELDGLDIFHGLSHELPWGVNARKTPCVVTIHDLLYRFFPEDFPLFDRYVYHKKFSYACKHADRIIAISEATKKDIITYFGTNPDKISVLYQTVDPVFYQSPTPAEVAYFREKYTLPTSYILYVGSLIKRKNAITLIKAYAALPKSLRPPLVMVGNGSAYAREVDVLIKELELTDYVIQIREINLPSLNVLYRQALFSVYPSLMEGFGLPVLESIVTGTPVITTKRSSLTEAGGDAAVYFDGLQVAELTDLMRSMIINTSNYKRDLLSVRTQHIAMFNPELLNMQLKEIYQSVL